MFLHSGKVIINNANNEPPRIPPGGHLHQHHTHEASTYQHPPAQPPTLSQAPHVMDSRLGRNGLSHASQPNLAHLDSPRPDLMHPNIRREFSGNNTGMIRSASLEDIHKHNNHNSSNVYHADHIERHNQRTPVPLQHMQSHFSSGFYKHPPSVMSVSENSKLKIEDSAKNRDINVNDRERIRNERDIAERERVLHERIAFQEHEKMLMEKGMLSHNKDRVLHHERERIANERDWELFRCQGCGKGFTHKGTFEKHNCKANDVLKSFQCSRCQLLFQEASLLKEHMATIHNSERLLKCSVCYRSFSGTNALNTHMRMHNSSTVNEHGLKEGGKTDCSKCGKHFTHSIELNKHLNSQGECTG